MNNQDYINANMYREIAEIRIKVLDMQKNLETLTNAFVALKEKYERESKRNINLLPLDNHENT